jgi:hypothetical protein
MIGKYFTDINEYKFEDIKNDNSENCYN